MATLNISFFIGSTSFLPVTRTCIKAWISSNFGQIRPLMTKLAALELLENRIIMFCLHFCCVQITRTTIKSCVGSKFA